MAAPQILAFRLVMPPPDPSVGGCIAVMTIEDGPWLVAGMRLHIDHRGKLYLKPPKLRSIEDRIVFRTGQQRDAILAQAKIMAKGFLSALTAEAAQ